MKMRFLVVLALCYAVVAGIVHAIERLTNHPSYNVAVFMDADISVLRTSTTIVYGNTVNAASFAGLNYNVADNAVVWAAGWGLTEHGTLSEQLRHVQLWIVNQGTCNGNYGFINSNMICSGNQGMSVRGQCSADSGGPLYHNGVVVGVTSFGPPDCGNLIRPVVSARVSSFITWIQANA